MRAVQEREGLKRRREGWMMLNTELPIQVMMSSFVCFLCVRVITYLGL